MAEENKSQSFGFNYDLPESKDAFIDTAKGEIIEKENLDPFEIIKAMAKATNTPIKTPRKGCKHCYGRGYIGKETKSQMPVPCSCIYPPKSPNEKTAEIAYDANKVNAVPNRKQRRAMRMNIHQTMKNPELKKRLKDIIRRKIAESQATLSANAPELSAVPEVEV